MVISVFYIISAVLSTKFRCLVLVEEGLFELFDYLEFLNFCFLEANLFLANITVTVGKEAWYLSSLLISSQ